MTGLEIQHEMQIIAARCRRDRWELLRTKCVKGHQKCVNRRDSTMFDVGLVGYRG
jgi:hypothetical protein